MVMAKCKVKMTTWELGVFECVGFESWELESLKLQLCYPTQILKDFSTCVKDNKESLSIFGLVYGLKNKER